MANTFVGVASTSQPESVQTEFSYPEDCYVDVMRYKTTDRQNQAVYAHDIRYAGAPAALFNAAPLGSTCVDYTNGDLYIKTDATTWTKASP